MLVTEQDLAFDTTTIDLDEGDVVTVRLSSSSFPVGWKKRIIISKKRSTKWR